MKAPKNSIIFNVRKNAPLNVAHDAMIHPLIIHLISQLGLIIFIAEKTRSTITVATGKIKESLMR
jgi:hypothetical protein